MSFWEQRPNTPSWEPLLESTFEIAEGVQSVTGLQKRNVRKAVSTQGTMSQSKIILYILRQAIFVNFHLRTA